MGNSYFDPSVVQDQSGKVYVFWDQTVGAVSQIFYNVTTTGNIATPTPQAFKSVAYNTVNFDQQPSAVMLKNGTLMMFFVSLRNGNLDIYYSRYKGSGQWSSETRLTTSPAKDQNPTATQDSSGRIWVAWNRQESEDVKISYVNTTTSPSETFIPGRTIVYDANGNGAYDSGEPIISGSAPSPGTKLRNDPRIGFFDSNGDGVWEPGKFVVFDSNVDTTYDPKFMYIDSNKNNVWDPGETIAYDAVSDGLYVSHTSVTTCAGTLTLDCVITGSVPANNTQMSIDSHIKFVDLNGDGLWQPGETVVYDANNNGVYDTNERIIAPLSSDPKLKYIGPGSTWSAGYAVAYDTNANGIYDGSILFSDDKHQCPANCHWIPGDSVVYHTDLNNLRYEFIDTVIAGNSSNLSSNTVLHNDPLLRFNETDSNGRWDVGEPVVYEANLNYNPNVYDGKIKFVDTNSNGHWDSGELVVYDTDASGSGVGVYNTGKYHNDPIIAGSAPANNTALSLDPKIRFRDTNADTLWETGEPVIYDANSNNLYDSGETVISGAAPASGAGVTSGLGDSIIAYGAPSVGTLLSMDPKMKYLELGNDSSPTHWDPGETVIYDSDNSGTYSTGDLVLLGTAPATGTALSSDSFRYVDSNSNSAWDSAETIVDELDNATTYHDLQPVVRGLLPVGAGLSFNVGEPWVGGSGPLAGSTLKSDSKIRFVSNNGVAIWNSAEPVVYDSNNNGVYDPQIDTLIAGSITLTQGTILKTDEVTLAGPPVVPGTTYSFPNDSKIKYVDSIVNGHWDPGETVVYDSDVSGPGVGVYNSGKYHNDTIVVGAAPANNTSLATDTWFRYHDESANSAWDNGEPVFYDSDHDSDTVYDSLDTLVVLGQTPSSQANLSADSNIKYFDANSDGVVDAGDTFVYGSSSTYIANETVITGPIPSVGTTVTSDSTHYKFVSMNGGASWTLGDPVVYDQNANGKYDLGDKVAVNGNTAFPGQPLTTATHILYSSFSSVSWSAESRLTKGAGSDTTPSITQTEDGKLWIAWSVGQSPVKGRIVYRTSIDGVNWTQSSNATRGGEGGSYGDSSPSIRQDRNGTIWIAFVRKVPCSCGGGQIFQGQVWDTTSSDNGASWPTQTALAPIQNNNQIQNGPTIAQLNDKRIYVFYPMLDCPNNNCSVNLYYMYSSPQSVHDAGMYSFAGTAVYGPSLRVGQLLHFSAIVNNTGDFSDTFLLTITGNGTSIPTNSSVVSPGQSKTIFVNWMAAVPKAGNYLFTATVTDLNGTESVPNLVDNTKTFALLIYPGGDVNLSCTVDIVDLVIVASEFGKTAGQPGYTAAADLNNDGVINIVDLSKVGSTFGQTC